MRGPSVPAMQLPSSLAVEVAPQVPGVAAEPVLEAAAGLATAAALPLAPVTLPVIVIPSLGAPGAAAGGGGGAGGSGLGPRQVGPEPPRVPGGRAEGKPGPETGSAAALNSPSYRAGYREYLRAAGLGQVAAVAVPGLTGILVLTGAGALLGYRQARAGHSLRAGGTARFVG